MKEKKTLYPFSFEIETGYYDENKGKWRAYINSGMGICENFTDAAKQIEHYFGEELVSINHLTLLGDGTLIFMELEWIKEIEKDDFYKVGRHEKGAGE